MPIRYLSGLSVDSTVLVVDAANDRVGIGTASPGYKLETIGNARISGNLSIGTTYNGFAANIEGIVYVINGSVWVNDGYGYANASSTNTGMFPDSSHNITFKTNNSARVYINSAGNVGIGTTSPSTTLDVLGKIKLGLDGTYGSSDYVTIGFGGTSNGYNRVFGYNGTSDGLYLTSATGHGISFRTNGGSTDNMVINSAGNVGIGTTSPSQKLHLYGSGNQLIFIENTGTYHMYTGLSSNVGIVGSTNATPLSLQTNGVSRVYLDTGGNVGIGTTAPGAKLDVVPTAQNGINVARAGGYPSLYSSNDLVFETDGVFYFGVYTPRVFSVNSSFYVTAAGNVGIGTAGPNAKLDVAGQIRSYAATGQIYSYSTTSSNTAIVFAGWTSGTGMQMGYLPDTAQGYVENTYPIAGGQVYGDIYFRQNSSGTMVTRMTIKADGGNVGIGTTSPAQKLTVAGNISLTGTSAVFLDGTSGWSAPMLGRDGTNIFLSDFSGVQLGGWDGSSYGARMTVQGTGNVGIGTTSPAQKFHVQGSNLMATFRNSSTGADQYTQLEFIAGSRDAYIWLGNQATTAWAGDGGLNIYTGTGHMDFWTAATQKMRLTASGNVGIGTTAPTEILHVKSPGNNGGVWYTVFLGQNSTGYQNAFVARVQDELTDLGAGIVGTNTGSNLTFSTHPNGGAITERVRITKTGNVGIGTTSPATKFVVSNAGASGFEVAPTGGVTSGVLLQAYNRSTSAYMAQSYYALTHTFNVGSGAVTRALDITSTGNVGIGTTGPLGTLDVGKSSATPSLVIGNSSYPSTYNSVWGLQGGAQSIMIFGNNGQNEIRAGSTGVGGYLDFYTNNTAVFTAASNGNFAMRLAANGNVGIGTTAPGANLEVASANTNAVVDIFNLYNPSQTSSGVRQRFRNGYGDLAAIKVSQIDNGAGADNGQIEIQTSTDAVLSTKLTILDTGAATFSSSVTASSLIKSGGTASQYLMADGSVSTLTNPVTGTGTTNYVPKFTGASTIGDSIIYETSNLIGIGTTSPTQGGGNAKWVTIDGTSYSGGIVYSINSVAKGYTYVESDLLKVQAQAGVGISFITNGNESARITSAGNVGIGTTSPGAPLHVYKSDTYSAIISRADWNSGTSTKLALGKQYGVLGFISSDLVETTNDTSYIALNYKSGLTTYAEGLRVYNNGNVGIGTTSPANKLVIDGGNVEIRTGGDLLLRPSGNDYDFGIRAESYRMEFGSAGFANVAMVYDTTGNVGIGTTAPGVKLDIDGGSNGASVRVKGDQPAGAYYYGFMYDGTNLKGTTQTNIFYSGSTIAANTTIAEYAGLRIDAPSVAATGAVVTNNYGIYQSGSVQKNYFAGNVGIGTTAPNAKLQVAGDIASTFGSTNGYVSLQAGNATVQGYVEWFKPGPTRVAYMGYNDGSTANNLAITLENSANFIVNNGNVGIGTTSPAGKLDVRAGSGGKIILGTYDANYNVTIEGGDQLNFYNGASATTGYINYNGPGNILLSRNLYVEGNSSGGTTGAVRITSTGNVGIGTTSPVAALHVQSASTKLFLSNTDFVAGTTGSGLILTTGASSGQTYSQIYAFQTGNTAYANLVVPGGNVGIGNTAPNEKLELSVGAGVTGGLRINHASSATNEGMDITYLNNGATTTSFDSRYNSDSAVMQFRMKTAATAVNAMTILGSGNVGIGTTGPTEKLHVDGSTLITYNNSFQSTNSVGNKAVLARVSPTSGIINYAEYATATNLNGFVIGSDDARVKGNIATDSLEFITNTSTRMTVLSSGNVGINTTTPGSTLHVIGDVLIQTGALGVGVNPNATDGRIDASNDIVAFSTSDRRLKENITPIANALEKVRSLTGVEFDWKQETKSVHGYEGHDVGVIAQDVQAVLPEAVRTNDSGYLSVRYEKMIALLVEAMKEQQAQIDELKKLIK